MSESKAAIAGGENSTDPPTAAASTEHVKEALDDAPDPDEDDLDDLDDMLDDFSAVKIDPKKQAAPAPAQPAEAAPAAKGLTIPTLVGDVPAIDPDDLSEEEFQRQLQAGMAELMGDLDKNPEMQAQFDSIFKELGAATALGSAPLPENPSAPTSFSSSSGGTTTGAGVTAPAEQVAADLSANASFQETIRRTMARMQESGDSATAAAAAGGSEDDFIAEMMKAMKDLPGAEGGAPGEAGSEEEFSKMLMSMMEQLTNKEILYEPMRELHDKFPGWMEKNREGLNEDDKKRYDEQMRLVKEMVEKFEEPSYKDENVKDREYIVERMQKMQAAGSPPPDLVGDMPSAKEVLDGPDDNCTPQ